MLMCLSKDAVCPSELEKSDHDNQRMGRTGSVRNRCLAAVQHDASVWKSAIHNWAEIYDGRYRKANMHYMCGRSNGNDRAALRMYHAQIPDERKLDHRILQQCCTLTRMPRLGFHGLSVIDSSLATSITRFIKPLLLFMGTCDESCLCDSTWLR
ncbi:hypothetical protein TNCV_1243171 [Trichonephila clavipes]|nr:hypothetical protein TNCV_1243171 [Trichonephila clavipes]